MGKRGRKPLNKRKGYFYEEQEQAVKDYLNADDKEEKDKIFNKWLKPAFTKMIESIIRRYNLYPPDENFQETFDDTISFLMTKIENFNVDSGYKAYSYCGTVCKNYLILRRTQSIKKRDKFLSYETVFSNPEKNNRFTNELKEDDFHTRLISQTKEEIQNILDNGQTEKRKLTENEVKLGNALIEILDHWEDMIDDSSSRKFNKVSMLYFIKEYTLCNTTEVRNAMKIYKNIYLFTKQDLLKE